MGIVIRLIIGALGLVVFSAPAYAHDMSGWTDKTICRLAKATPDNVEYQTESTKRGLSCGGAVTQENSSSSTNSSPLRKIWPTQYLLRLQG